MSGTRKYAPFLAKIDAEPLIPCMPWTCLYGPYFGAATGSSYLWQTIRIHSFPSAVQTEMAEMARRRPPVQAPPT